MEALIYRLFAEKQFALALLALGDGGPAPVGRSSSCSGWTPPSSQARAAPASSQRLDVRCEAGAARTVSGQAITRTRREERWS